MDIKRFILSYYRNAAKNFHINKINNPTEALKLHVHDYFQLYFVLKGSICHHLDDKKALLSCGDVFIIPPNVKHFITKEETDTVFYSLSFTHDFFENQTQPHNLVTDFLHQLISSPSEKIPPKLSLLANDSLFVETLLERIMNEFTEKNVGSEEIIQESTAILIALFARNYFNEKTEDFTIDFETNKQSILYCIEYISTHYADDITLDDICRYATMSKASFCRLFSEITKMNFKKFLHTKRIERATELITSDKYKLSTIATLCGYDDFSTFYRNFKKISGVSPAEFKRINRL